MVCSCITHPEISAWMIFGFILSRVTTIIGPSKLTTGGAMQIFKVIGFWAGTIAMGGLVYYSYQCTKDLKA